MLFRKAETCEAEAINALYQAVIQLGIDQGNPQSTAFWKRTAFKC